MRWYRMSTMIVSFQRKVLNTLNTTYSRYLRNTDAGFLRYGTHWDTNFG